ncbi:Mitochondrial amidoxime-reducing component 1 [Orchesella cincta]|uniref:Mitochondrial amidoxime-reducing component 1 n=1 Tax=Orchesella cincta TaxID=48709 RepID=A0A1D2MTC9_ORCCI|nr:Mitochondrial amidoxime-reducing component 1 [Orchesella cincta]
MDLIKGNWKLATGFVAAAATGAIAGMAVSELRKDKMKESNVAPQKWIRVGAVCELILYPIKSCKGVSVHEAHCTKIGLKASKYLRDRIFMVVNDRNAFQTQRQIPKMALINVTINENRIILTSPGFDSLVFIPPEDKPELRRSCRVFEDRIAEALDCGDEVANWLSKFLEMDGLRLLYHYRETTQRELTSLQQKFPHFSPEDKGAFSDQTSYMLMSEESIKMLNTKLDKPVSHRNFRPSILVTGVVDPFSEDYWGYIRIGDYGPVFKSSKPCTRCKLTTVNPDNGVFDAKGEPLSTLTKLVRTYGNKTVDELVGNQAVIGLQLGIIQGDGGTIRVGDPVFAAVL